MSKSDEGRNIAKVVEWRSQIQNLLLQLKQLELQFGDKVPVPTNEQKETSEETDNDLLEVHQQKIEELQSQIKQLQSQIQQEMLKAEEERNISKVVECRFQIQKLLLQIKELQEKLEGYTTCG